MIEFGSISSNKAQKIKKTSLSLGAQRKSSAINERLACGGREEFDFDYVYKLPFPALEQVTYSNSASCNGLAQNKKVPW